MLTRLCEGRVHATDQEVQMAFDAHHGEKVEGRMILWPPDQHKTALMLYPKIRDSEEEFTRQAKQQASPSLAATGGRVPPIGRHTLGDDNLEREVFQLNPGEVTSLVGTPQGHVIFKCDKRIPPDTKVKLADVRDQLVQEVVQRKTNQEMQVVFKELRDKAQPRLILKDASRPEDLVSQTQRILADSPNLPPPAPPKAPEKK
jgi:hypothetical protein